MYIGIDLGGTNIAAGVVDKEGNILHKDSVKCNATRHYTEIVKDMAELSKKVTLDAGFQLSDIEWVGIGSPGTCDTENGVLVYANNLNFKNVPMSEEFRKTLDVPVYIANDADAAAFGEAMVGAAKDVDNSVTVTLGTGVGGGIIINNKIFNGFNHAGAELGHMVISMNGEPCTCGNFGCWEAYASATALVKQTNAAMEKNPDSMMHEFAKEKGVSARTAFQAAKAGDAAGLEVVKKYIEYVSQGISNIVTIFQPEKVLVGGGVSGEKDYLINPIREYVAAHDYCKTEKHTLIDVAQLGNDAGIIGAAFLGKQFVSEV